MVSTINFGMKVSKIALLYAQIEKFRSLRVIVCTNNHKKVRIAKKSPSKK